MASVGEHLPVRFDTVEQLDEFMSRPSPALVQVTDPAGVASLPRVANVVFMAGQKFGTAGGREDEMWAMNCHVPALVASHLAGSRIVAYSTIGVYPINVSGPERLSIRALANSFGRHLGIRPVLVGGKPMHFELREETY